MIVTSPLGDETQHFFNVNTKSGSGRSDLELYGYPVRGVSHQPTPPVPLTPPQPADSLLGLGRSSTARWLAATW